MKYKLAMYHRMQQRLTLTPLMRQSMQLLSMSAKELNEYVDSLLEKNPFLKKQFEKKSHRNDYISKNNTDSTYDYINDSLASKNNPRESLISQLRMFDFDDTIIKIAEYLIYEMDDNGYIRVDTRDTAEELSAPKELVEKVILLIQRMEPAGIGARNTQECLRLQLERAGKAESLECTIVNQYMMELAQNNIDFISKDLDVDKQLVISAISNIKKLNPKPASTVLAKNADPIIPDLVAKTNGREVFLELNREWAPQLRLYNPYENKLEIIKDPEVKEFLKKNMGDAKGLIDNLKRREETMCKVANYILKHQKEALSGELSKIKTLTMGQVAEELKMHPSTISRTVSNKYVQLADKVLPLKSFLSHSIKKENGELTSKTSVKSRIKHIIDFEDKSKPLSDNTVMGILLKEDIGIKRRTVAKYRESLKILPTHLRRKRHIPLER